MISVTVALLSPLLEELLSGLLFYIILVKEKFDNRIYESITQFVADFRLMLENCYRYNGPDHVISKKAQRLETVMEQKLTLLSR